MNTEIPSGAMQWLLGVNKVAPNDLAKRGIVVRGRKRGTYAVEASVSGYCHHLRDMAAGRGGEHAAEARARARAGTGRPCGSQGGQLRGETLPVAEIEKLWTSKLRAFRNRVLAILSRVKDLSARQRPSLTQELRAALTELADGR